MQSRGLKRNQTRSKNGGSALAVLRHQGGYRINKDGSISFAAEVLSEKESYNSESLIEGRREIGTISRCIKIS